MRFTALILASTFALSTLAIGCERKDVKKEMQEDMSVMEADEEGPLTTSPSEASDELPGVPDKLPGNEESADEAQ